MTLSPFRPSPRERPQNGGPSPKRHDRDGQSAALAAGLNRGLLRVEEAAEWLGISRTKAYDLVYRGTLRSVTIGRSRRVPVAALEAFVDRLLENGGVL